ncbi:hypothetical protein [Mycobacterium deserti]|uniref:Uncharacterized protein n=1 Tax=Mycobacterium deserti TaxID=2978347 RepID=A0ABT2MCD5_9MYCO|nr:hypothetical protein [Mycobacterium deserti]MCT7659930.1 hypothetical protein [Mycobacterium deserti]
MSEDWAPKTCTLPTVDRPLRIAEFDRLFAFVLRAQRSGPTQLGLVLPRHVEAAARDLARRESECCSFFAFEFGSDGGDVLMCVTVPPAHIGVLDAIEARCGRPR